MSCFLYGKRIVLVAAILLTAGFLFIPYATNAVFTEADAFCGTQYCYPGKCTPSPFDPGCVSCQAIPCVDITNDRKTIGICKSSAPGVCRGISSEGLDGKQTALGIPKEIMDILKGVLDKLMQQGSQGSQQQQQLCPSYYQVTTPTTDPCAIYSPGASNLLTSPFGETSGQDIVGDLMGSLTNEQSDPYVPSEESGVSEEILRATESESDMSSSEPPLASGVLDTPVSLGSGLYGRIEEIGTGATAIASERDETRGFEVAGFYGQTGTWMGEGGMVARLCVSRPWAGSFITYVIPSSFFDGLCERRGYKPPPPLPVVQTAVYPVLQPLQQTKKEVKQEKLIPAIEPEAHVWAVPARVSIGSRTLVFWNSRGVESCIVTSPDGSFHETGFSGGASTVPLSGVTVFTISCVATDGEPATDYVTVEMAI